MRIINAKQIKAITSLSGNKRYAHFIKVIADTAEVWGLYQDDGWALAATDEGIAVFPVWPAKEYAQLCVKAEWENYEPKLISLDEFMNELLQQLKCDAVLPGVFPTPSSQGVTLAVDELKAEIEHELLNYK